MVWGACCRGGAYRECLLVGWLRSLGVPECFRRDRYCLFEVETSNCFFGIPSYHVVAQYTRDHEGSIWGQVTQACGVIKSSVCVCLEERITT